MYWLRHNQRILMLLYIAFLHQEKKWVYLAPYSHIDPALQLLQEYHQAFLPYQSVLYGQHEVHRKLRDNE